MEEKVTYTSLMQKRKTLMFEGKYKEAYAIEDQADELIKQGKVSEEEVIAAAYL